MARDAPVGIVIRRGPSKLVRTMLWNRQRDTFTLGQWLKGRIYGEMSDISADGKYWIYMALGDRFVPGLWHWTAVARAPWLTALAFYPNDYGGEFISSTSYWVCQNSFQPAERDTDEVQRNVRFRPTFPSGGGYERHLLRDGWIALPAGPLRARSFERRHPSGWGLRMFIRGRSSNQTPGQGIWVKEYSVVHPLGNVVPRSDWEWAEIDGKRVVWAASGKLFAAEFGSEDLVHQSELYDFNPMQFEELTAPY